MSAESRTQVQRIASFGVGITAVFVGVTWLALTFLRFGPVEFAPGIWADYFGWALDFNAYHDAAIRIATTGTPYAPELIDAKFAPGPAGLYYYSPLLASVLTPTIGLSAADASILWFFAQLVALGASCALMPVLAPIRAFAFAILAISSPCSEGRRVRQCQYHATCADGGDMALD